MTYVTQLRSTPSRRAARPIILIALLIAVVACSGGSEPEVTEADPDRAVEGGAFPAGWEARPDRGGADQIAFAPMGEGFHFTMGPAATFYNAEWTKSGDYQFSASLTQTVAPSHPTSYGLMVGGSDLGGANQTYTYFLVRNEGDYFIANREGDDRPVVVDWTQHEAVNKQGGDGRQTNTLGIQVQGDNVIFTANGTELTRLPKAQLHTDGLYGFRIGHNLDITVDQISR